SSEKRCGPAVTRSPTLTWTCTHRPETAVLMAIFSVRASTSPTPPTVRSYATIGGGFTGTVGGRMGRDWIALTTPNTRRIAAMTGMPYLSMPRLLSGRAGGQTKVRRDGTGRRCARAVEPRTGPRLGLDDPPVVHVGNHACEVEDSAVVGDDEDGTFGANRLASEQLHDFVSGLSIEGRGRLIAHDQPWLRPP